MTTDILLLDTTDRVRTVTFNRPESRNALSAALRSRFFAALRDAESDNGVDVVTLGQYLQPTQKHLPVVRFVHPDEFAFYREEGLKMGIDYVESGPLVRSSYHSERHIGKR